MKGQVTRHGTGWAGTGRAGTGQAGMGQAGMGQVAMGRSGMGRVMVGPGTGLVRDESVKDRLVGDRSVGDGSVRDESVLNGSVEKKVAAGNPPSFNWLLFDMGKYMYIRAKVIAIYFSYIGIAIIHCQFTANDYANEAEIYAIDLCFNVRVFPHIKK
jgi:hypothetical protein